MLRVRIEIVGTNAIKRFTEIAQSVDCDVRLVGKDENGNDWDISAKSLLCSLVMSRRNQAHREHTVHDVDWNTIWCVCEKDIYTMISDFVVA